MKGIWAGSPGLLLGLLVAGAQAQEAPWHPANGEPARAQTRPSAANSSPGATLGRPVALGTVKSAVASAPAVVLGRPVVVPAAKDAGAQRRAMVDPSLIPTAFNPVALAAPGRIVRGKSMDAPLPLPMGTPQKGPVIVESEGQPAAPGLIMEEKAPPSLEPQIVTGDPRTFGDGTLTEGACGEESGMGCDGASCNGSCSDGNCCDGVCCPGDGTGLAPCYFWVRGEYLLWNIKDAPAPPLVTTGPTSSAGVLGRGATVLYGGPIDQEEMSGGRVTAGLWLDPCQCWGVEGSAFFLGKRSTNFTASSTGTPLLARPDFNTFTGMPGSELVAANGVVVTSVSAPPEANPAPIGTILFATGTIRVNTSSDMWGAEVNGLYNLCRPDWGRLDFLAGGRYIQLKESLEINEDLLLSAIPPGGVLTGPSHQIFDDLFATRNQFYGGQVGLRGEWYWGRWQLDATGKVALGNTHQTVDISGFRNIDGTVSAGGLLAQQTNSGHFTQNKFAVVPELGVNLGYQLTDHWRAYVGYNFLYWSSVARPGDQIDTRVNPTQLVRTGFLGTSGVANPAFSFRDSEFWAYGANAGLEFRY